jgi:aminomethyltransferase
LTDVDVASVRWFHFIPEAVSVAGVRGLLTRTGFTGELGYEFFLMDAEGAERVWDAIVEGGATPFGLDAIELLRVEAGLLIQDEDYVPGGTDPYELSLDPYIELDGHDFVGRRAAAGRAARPSRRLVTLAFDGPGLPRAGNAITRDGVRVGDVRSPVRTPRFGSIALGTIDAAIAGDGEAVVVEGRLATVRPAPIDDPGKLRPRSDPRTPVTID